MNASILDSIGEYRPRTYRRLSNGAYGVGIVGLLLGVALEAELVGLGVFVVGCLAGMAIPYLTSTPVYDERDEAISARASELVLSVLAAGGLATFVVLFGLQEAGRYTWSSELTAVFYAWSAFWLFWGGTYTFVRLRRR